jgi:rhodanese-related sulfurtransferase
MSFLAFLEKNWVLVLAMLASGAMLVWPLIARRLGAGREINSLAVTQLINTRNPLLLDLRETREYAGGRLPDAVHVPLSQLRSRGGELAKHVSRPVVAYCERGVRSRAAGGILARQGFKEVFLLHGGFKAWKEAGLPVQKP